MQALKVQRKVLEESTLLMNVSFCFVGYLYLCNNSAVKCVPCTVPHFIVHKDTKMISPKT